MKAINTILIFLLLVCLQAKAQWTNNANLNTEVKDSVGPEESVPLSATTSDGMTYISYYAYYGGSNQMRMQLFDTAGNKLFGSLGLLINNQLPSAAFFRYDMKVDDNDNAIVAFQDTRTNGDLHVVVYKIDKSGNFLWGANGIQLIDSVSSQGVSPTIGFTNAGNVIVGWTASSANNYKWVAFQKFSAAGAVLWADNLRVIDSTFTHKYSRQTFAPAGTDDFLMLYAEESGSGSPLALMFAQRYDGNGNMVWPNVVKLSVNNINYTFFCEAVPDGSGGFYVGFNTSTMAFPSQDEVYVQHIDGNGVIWNTTGNTACTLSATQKFTAATRFDPINNVAWILIRTTAPNQNGWGFAIQKIDSAGNLLLGSTGFQLVPVGSVYLEPYDFCITSNGVISIYNIGANSNQTLHAIKNDFTGAVMWGGNSVDICSHNGAKGNLTAGLFAHNQVVVAWDDTRNDYGVYAQNITNEGLLGIVSGTQVASYEKGLFSVWPNPFTEKIRIQFDDIQGTENIAVKIYSIFGNKLYDQKLLMAEMQIDAKDWGNGVYIIELSSKNGILKREKIIKE